uniref:Usp domain-containing protein n=1 Tax=Steinernema glaseri TaxID=37863 RepID=A0A1I7YH12_9BILA
MVGTDSEENQNELEKARTTLASSGLLVHAEIRPGEVESVLPAYQAEHGIDLLVMGAYGHSRIRQFLNCGNAVATLDDDHLILP